MSKAAYDSENKIWSGPKAHSYYNTDQNIGYLIFQNLQSTPDSVIQISADTGVSVTCYQMYDRSVKIAKYLTKSGLKGGDLIGYVTANTENLAPIVFACFALGLPVNPLSPIMNEKDIVQMFSMTKPKLIFCDAENVKVVQNAVNEMKSEAKILTVMDKVDEYECVTEILKSMQNENIDYFQHPSIDSNSTAAIICSSGSTGFPKGVCKSHKQIISGFTPFAFPGEVPIYLQTSPIYWLSGFSALINGTLSKYTRVITSKPYTVEDFVDIMNKYKVSVVTVAPYFVLSLLDYKALKPLEYVKLFIIGGAVVSGQLCEKFRPFIPNGIYINGYGCTEEDSLAVNFSQNKLGAAGIVSANVQIKIVDAASNSLGPNESGEIYCKIPVHFSGYIGDPVKTAEAFDGDWFKTGDIGYFDDDQFLFVTGRTKELLKYKGYQVTPSEIENIINEIQGIASSCVVGVSDGDSGNDIIHAFVILEESKTLTGEFILKYVNNKVIDPKRIRGGLHIVDSFPLGMTGKVDRKKLKELSKKLGYKVKG